MNYTLHQLQVFLQVVESGSVTQAAEALHLTQPAVSIQLKNLQDQFEMPLTEVIGRKIYITEFGREMADAAARILEQVKAINDRTLAFKGQLSGRLKLSIVSTGKYVMPYFLTDFLHQHSGVELLMDVTNKSRVVESLAKNEVDFALVSILPVKPAVEKLDLLQNKLYLVGNQKLKSLSAKEQKEFFTRQTLIFREPGSGTRQTMERFINKKQIMVPKKLELTSNEAVKQAVIAGLGFSIMPLIGIRNELQNRQMHIIPVRGLPIKTTWSLIWLKGKKHSLASQAFLDHLRSEKSRIVTERFHWYEQY